MVQKREIGVQILDRRFLRFNKVPSRHLIDFIEYYRIPGLSMVIIEDFKIARSMHFGEVEHGSRQGINPETMFLAGSISKPVAALLILALVEQGTLELDTDVNQYLQSWKIPRNGNWQPKITIRQILSHTAGLTIHGFPGYPTDKKLASTIEILNGSLPANTMEVMVDILPSTQFRYSGGGYTVLQQVIEDVTGEPFADLAQKIIFEPLEMYKSTYKNPLPQEFHEFAATGHTGSYETPVHGRWHIYPEMAAAGLWTTAEDLAKLVIEIQLSLVGKSNKILSQELTKQMLSKQRNSITGLGFFFHQEDDKHYFRHGGWDEGFVSEFIAHKKVGHGIVIMTNKDFGSQAMMRNLVETVAQAYEWPDFLPDTTIVDLDTTFLEPHLGKYIILDDVDVELQINNGSLFIQIDGQDPLQLHPRAKKQETKKEKTIDIHSFFAKDLNIELEFILEKELSIVLKQNTARFSMKRIKP